MHLPQVQLVILSWSSPQWSQIQTVETAKVWRCSQSQMYGSIVKHPQGRGSVDGSVFLRRSNTAPMANGPDCDFDNTGRLVIPSHCRFPNRSPNVAARSDRTFPLLL